MKATKTPNAGGYGKRLTKDVVLAYIGDISKYIWRNSDVGMYWAVEIETGTEHFYDHDQVAREVVQVEFVTIKWPNSSLRFSFGASGTHLTIDGRRGSVQDCIVPTLTALGVSLDGWAVDTTRPDVPWYDRCPGNAGLTRVADAQPPSDQTPAADPLIPPLIPRSSKTYGGPGSPAAFQMPEYRYPISLRKMRRKS